MAQIFTPLPDKPDHNALELEILERWEREGTFERLREQNRGGPTFSFVDGPVTANKALGVHTAWGRTLKDVFQRYKALRGLRPALPERVRLPGPVDRGRRRARARPQLEARDRGVRARGVRAALPRRGRQVVGGADARARMRLGQWMDWGNDYFTFSDTNIEYIWRFLKLVHERGWLYLGHRSTEWCPRCGTSLSQHELTQSGVYQERSDPSLFVRFPLLDRPGRVARRLDDDAVDAARERRGGRQARRASTGCARTASGSRSRAIPTSVRRSASTGTELVGLRYRGPFDDLGPGADVEHRVIPWDEVSLEEGTGIVHIAPGAAARTSSSAAVHGLPVLTPGRRGGPLLRRLRMAARPLDGRGRRPDRRPTRARRASCVEAGTYEHRYPHCWRCDTPLIWRVTDDWLIARRRAAPAAPRGERDGGVDARVHGQAHGRLAAQHGRLEHLAPPLLRAPAAVLPVLVRAPERDRLEGGAARARGRRARPARGAPATVDRRVPIRCESCGETVERIPEVGDVWLDAGIVPFSTLGWQNDE